MNEGTLLAIGKGAGIIVGVTENDKEGRPLMTGKGFSYKRLRLTVVDRNGHAGYIFDNIWGDDKNKTASILKAIGDEDLQASYVSGSFLLQDLIGRDLELVIGVRTGTNGYSDSNIVECYLPYNKSKVASRAHVESEPERVHYVVREEEDELPF